MKKLLCLFLTMILVIAQLAACGGGASDEELLSALSALAPEAKELYSIIYGDALPHGEIGNDDYGQISPDAPYQSISELRAAIGKVFSHDYAKILANTAFNGVSSDEGMISAKFIERGYVLFVNPEVTEDFGEPREFDLSKAKVLKKNPYMAIVLLVHEEGDLEVSMKNVDGVWLIDSPMF